MGNIQDSTLIEVLTHYGIESPTKIESFGKGLINTTWKISTPANKYIFQKLNLSVFKNPEAIDHNIRIIGQYLKKTAPEYLFTDPIESIHGKDLMRDQYGNCYRLFPYIENTYSVDVVENPEQAYFAAKAFGEFTRLTHGLDLAQLRITIPHFHNLSFRYEEFFWAIHRTDDLKKNLAKEEIHFLSENRSIALEYELIKKDPEFKLRVTHHDTKINNVLFESQRKVSCIIDLDTVMPGYFISDLGDMIRTYSSPVSEEETDLEKVKIRAELLDFIIQGYLSEMENILSPLEKKYLHYSGKYMIYMQAMRFLTDYLNGDVYYKSQFPGQNLIRAKNQIQLYKELMKFKDYFNNLHPGQR